MDADRFHCVGPRRRDLHLAHRRSQAKINLCYAAGAKERSQADQAAKAPNEVCRLGEVDCMKAVAKKKDQTRAEATADFQAMGILRCDACGDDFVIYHSPAFVDKSVADRQAYWLEKVLAEEHERDKKHPDRIELPD
jgi:predicted metal-binding protein